ncbi:GNAT family N-acetyltransferase [Klebsiella aerogenes]|uniref:GNAT family N-acetyltransferase n=1 Tax=Klebsiella aerogenes TaxID=548 RepID=UPI001D0D649A
MFNGMAETVKSAPVAERGVPGNDAVFFTHQHWIAGNLPGLKPGNTVIDIDGFVIPDGSGMQYGVITGYSSFGDWRAFDGFRHTVEHSVYVHPDHQGKGIGRKLLVALIAEARRLRKHVMVAGIESRNHASLHLHETLGFITTGQMPQVGTKFGRWLDLTFMQLQLDDRQGPDGEV